MNKHQVNRKQSDLSSKDSQASKALESVKQRPRTSMRNSQIRSKQRETFYSQLGNDKRFYKEDFNYKKKVTQTKTSYNFMQEHSDLAEHVVNPKKSTSRFTDSNVGKLQGKYDQKSHIISGSPVKKVNGMNHFRSSIDRDQEPEFKNKLLSPQKTRDLLGSGHVNPPTKEEIQSMMQRYGSPEKQRRVDGIHGSNAIKTTLHYQDNDISYSLVNAKPQNNAIVSSKDLKKEQWKPKVTLRWTEEPRQKLTLQ